MTNAKVTLTKEVAEAIEYLRSQYKEFNDNSTFIEAHAEMRSHKNDLSWWDRPILNGVTTETFSRAILNGYEVEKSPEEKVREYYERCVASRIQAEKDKRPYASENYGGQAIGASITLDILGIKIEGVNA